MAIAALDLQAPGGGMPGAIGDAHAAVDAALAAGAGGVGSLAELRAALGEAERLVRRAEAVRLAVIREIDRRGAAASAGHTDTGSFVAMVTNTDRVKAAGAARLAADLEASATGAALARGEISSEHARVITQALADLPGSVEAGGQARIERRLLGSAQRLAPRELRRASRRALAEVEPDPVVVDAHENALLQERERRAWEKSRFWLRRNDDGTATGGFTVPVLAGEILKKVIDAMTAPRRATGEPHPAGPGAAAAAGSLERDDAAMTAGYTSRWNEDGLAGVRWQQRRGQALASVLERLPTDHLNDKIAATLLVHVDLETLRGEREKVGATDVAEDAPAGTLRRWAAAAGIIPTVLGGGSLPLDLGRQARCFTPAQRAALSAVYQECAAEGCGRPFAWCEIHHQNPWQDGGVTDLANAIPLCGHHHRMIDHAPHTIEPADPPGPRQLGPPAQAHRPQRKDRARRTVRFHHRT